MAEYVLEMRDITKRFAGVVALDAARFALRPGEVHGLVGGTGAGKSTLMGILAGAQRMDAGEILIEDFPALITSPRAALDLGVSMSFQQCGLVPRLSVAENIFLGRAPRRGRRGPVSWRRLYEEARAVLDRMGMDEDPRRPVGELGASRRKMVEIARALSVNARILVMDAPGAALDGGELETLFGLIKLLRRGGTGVIYIPHRVEELFGVAQRVTVMRNGKHAATRDMCDTTPDELLRMMADGGNTDAA